MSKRKAHSKHKRYQRQAEAALNDMAICMALSVDDGKSNGYRLSKCRREPITPTVVNVIAECHFKWAFLLVVWSEEKNGKERVTVDFQRMASAYNHISLISYLEQIHKEMIQAERAKGNDVFDAGWVAVPMPKLDDDNLEAKMLDVVSFHRRSN